jgi:dienelactone hydrolase
MRLCTLLVLIASGLTIAAPSRAARGPLDRVAETSPDGVSLRARLSAFADSVAAADPALAAQALAWAGESFAREARPDSAVTCHERAMALDSSEARRVELASALIARLAPGDAARAREVLRPVQPATPQLPDITQAPLQGLFAWSHYLAGRADSAAALFAPVERWLTPHQEWRYRMACVAFEREEWPRTLDLLTPLAVASRTFDSDVMGMMHRAAESLGADRRLLPMLGNEIARRDKNEQALLGELGAHRVGFRGEGGFPLGGTVVAPRRATRPRGAVVLVAPGDTLALYDSLAVGLRRMGLAVMLLDVRGSGRSVGPSCPLPDSWRGRETLLQSEVAADVSAAAAALARDAGCDSSQYLVVGVGVNAPIAIRAAARDPAVKAVLLVSPTASPADLGALRAAVAGLKPPIYYQTGPQDFTSWDVIDALYEASRDARASRVADSETFGSRATIFRRGRKIFNRFSLWLSETWPHRAAPRATPPSRPRSG